MAMEGADKALMVVGVESNDKTLETSLTLLTFVLLPYKEGP